MRSPSEMGIVQLDVTNACKLRCSNCTRLVAHQTQPFMMSLEQFEQAVRSMEGWYKPGRVLGVMGGEPTLHPRFEEIARLFERLHWKGGNFANVFNHSNGRQPVKDFNAYVTERLHDRRSGRGLWTSLGDKYYEHYETIQDVFDHQCVNTHENPGLHQALLVTRKELGISDEEWPKLRDKCWVQNTWSASITPHGAYFCEVAGAIDNLFYNGKHAWKVEPGWWKRTPEEFGDQLNLCEHCGLACPGPSAVAQDDRDVIGRTALPLLQNSPAVKKGCFTEYTPDLETPKLEDRVDRYMPSPDMRVAPGHKSVLPRRTACVVVCVGRAEHLKRTLPFNVGLVDQMVVVTHPDDADTIGFVMGTPDVTLVKSERCYEGSMAFNKGAMLNEGLKAVVNPDWIIFTDADIFLSPKLRSFLASHAINPGCLYGTVREEEASPENVNAEPNGYFQLWNRRALAVRDRFPAVMSEAFCSAGSVDSWFMQQYPEGRRVLIPELAVKHIPHGDFAAGWNGPKPKQPGWRQLGLISPRGFFQVEQPERIERLRLTDTRYGQTAEVESSEIPAAVLRQQGGRLYFQGRDIGHHHVHVAYRCES